MPERLDCLPWSAINGYIEEIGAARSREQFLSNVIGAIHKLIPFDSEAGFFQILGPCLHSFGASEKRLIAYTNYYQHRQPIDVANPPPSFLGVTTTDWTRFRHSETVTDFLIPGGCYKTLTAVMPQGELVVALHRSKLAPRFTDPEIAIAGVLTPHIKNLYAIWEKFANQSCREPSIEEIIDAFGVLSHREAEIGALVCRGLSAGEMATKLFISKRTVETHLANIYDKLDVQGRTRVKALLRSVIERGPAPA